MSWWTEEQDDVLREVSFRGAAFAAAEANVISHCVRLWKPQAAWK